MDDVLRFLYIIIWSLSVLSCYVFVCILLFFRAFSCYSLFFFFHGVALHPILSPYRMPSVLSYRCLQAHQVGFVWIPLREACMFFVSQVRSMQGRCNYSSVVVSPSFLLVHLAVLLFDDIPSLLPSHSIPSPIPSHFYLSVAPIWSIPDSGSSRYELSLTLLPK